jgi:hypothetical protein
LPTLSLAFEYQGEIHYFATALFGPASKRKRVDTAKIEDSKRMGITVLSIPFWWDKSLSSLSATILCKRMDITLDSSPGREIPMHIPSKYQRTLKYHANNAQEYNEKRDPTGWFVMDFYVLI